MMSRELFQSLEILWKGDGEIKVIGFEPMSPRSQSECATKLRYTLIDIEKVQVINLRNSFRISSTNHHLWCFMVVGDSVDDHPKEWR